MSNMIEVKNLTKRFKEANVLKDVTLSFEEGKIHGIIGRNGSGKTMLFKCICGFVPPTSGSVVVDGKVVGRDCNVPGGIGIIIEAPGFLPHYSGYQNLKFLASINRRISNERIKQSMQIVGLDPNNKKSVGKYSLGMRQRLGLAQAIMEEPKILLLDEPMNGLDNHGVGEIRKLLMEMKEEGKTILLASHNKEDIDVLCDTVHEMDNGQII